MLHSCFSGRPKRNDDPPENCAPLRERAEHLYHEALAYLELSRHA